MNEKPKEGMVIGFILAFILGLIISFLISGCFIASLSAGATAKDILNDLRQSCLLLKLIPWPPDS